MQRPMSYLSTTQSLTRGIPHLYSTNDAGRSESEDFIHLEGPGKTVSIEVFVKYLLSGVVLPTFSTTLPVLEMDLGIELSTKLSLLLTGFCSGLFAAESTF